MVGAGPTVSEADHQLQRLTLAQIAAASVFGAEATERWWGEASEIPGNQTPRHVLERPDGLVEVNWALWKLAVPDQCARGAAE